MKKILVLFIILLSGVGIESYAFNDENVEVYYFHYTRRCATCQAVEDVTKASLNELYEAEQKDGKIVFISVNLDDEDNEKLAEQLEVGGQSLLVVKGEQKIDLTTKAFMYARTQPAKLKKSLKKTIEDLI